MDCAKLMRAEEKLHLSTLYSFKRPTILTKKVFFNSYQFGTIHVRKTRQRNFNSNVCLDISIEHENICIFLSIASLWNRMTAEVTTAAATRTPLIRAIASDDVVVFFSSSVHKCYCKEAVRKNMHIFLYSINISRQIIVLKFCCLMKIVGFDRSCPMSCPKEYKNRKICDLSLYLNSAATIG